MMRLASIISRIERHKEKAKEMVKMDISDYLVFNALAMECFQAVNSAIELGELVISEKNLGFPATYREIFELLHDANVIGKKNLENIKRLIFFRNLIAHEYYTITQKELKEMANLLDSLNEMVENAKKLFKEGKD